MRPTKTFSIDVYGETTGDHYSESFECNTYLTHKEDLARDRHRRAMLGGADPDNADARAYSIAAMVSQLTQRLVKPPEWLIRSDMGLNLADDNVIGTIWDECSKAEAEQIAKAKERADKARGLLQNPIPAPEVDALK